eukprot:12534469-Ditylum_brightwellii.AAC.1
MDKLASLPRTCTRANLQMVIGVFGYYSKFLLLYALEIQPWRAILVQQSKGEVKEISIPQEENGGCIHWRCQSSYNDTIVVTFRLEGRNAPVNKTPLKKLELDDKHYFQHQERGVLAEDLGTMYFFNEG